MNRIPAEAIEALAAAVDQYVSPVLEIHRPPIPGPGPDLVWRVVVSGLIVAASQPHLVGRPRR